MTYEDFKKKVYSHLIRYKKENLGIAGKGISSHGVEHDCLFPKPYCEEKLPSMLYADTKPVVVDIQASRFAYKPHLAASAHVASSQTACINLFVPILESESAIITSIVAIITGISWMLSLCSSMVAIRVLVVHLEVA